MSHNIENKDVSSLISAKKGSGRITSAEDMQVCRPEKISNTYTSTSTSNDDEKLSNTPGIATKTNILPATSSSKADQQKTETKKTSDVVDVHKPTYPIDETMHSQPAQLHEENKNKAKSTSSRGVNNDTLYESSGIDEVSLTEKSVNKISSELNTEENSKNGLERQTTVVVASATAPTKGSENLSSPSINSEDCNEGANMHHDDATDQNMMTTADLNSDLDCNHSQNPFLHKTVKITRGQFKGQTGKIIKLHTRGWWTLDNESLKGEKIHPRFCELVDEITTSESANYYKYNLPSIILRQQGHKPKPSGTFENHSVVTNKRVSKRPHKRTPEKASKSIQQTSGKKRKATQRAKRDSPRKLLKSPRFKRVMITSTMKESFRTLLQPIISGDLKQKRAKIDVLPPFTLEPQTRDHNISEALCHLPYDLKLDIFDRKNGRILTGKDAISVQDLPKVLKLNTEYEPIIPPPSNILDASLQSSEATSSAPREARSSCNTVIKRHVQPQIRLRASNLEGRSVKIISGQYEGLTGKVDSCIPGNWYLISHLFSEQRFDLDYVVHSSCIELLPEQSENVARGTTDIFTKTARKPKSSLALALEQNIKELKQKISSIALEIDEKTKVHSASKIGRLQNDLKDSRAKLTSRKLSLKMLGGNTSYRERMSTNEV